MSKEILMVVDVVSNEKGVTKDVIFEAIESALASATRRKHGGDMDVRVSIHRETGEYEAFRRWLVMDDEDPEFETPERQILYSYAIQNHPDIQIGDYIEEPIEAEGFGRIAAQTAKQVIVQKVREAERAKVVEEYEGRIGQLLMGTVKRAERSGVYLDLGNNAEAFIPREEMVARESVRPNDRLRGYLREVRPEARGPQLFVTRTAPEFLIELFKLEVPEVGQGLIDILAAARDPGMRAKIAVRSNDPRLDPVGACVGMRGSRVQSVSNELAGERIDIILWDDNPAQFVINAMSPAEVLSIVVDEESRSMDIAVSEEKLSQAIGRGGQNVRLASQLTGWELNVMSQEQAVEKSEQEAAELQQMFMDSLDVDEEVAVILVQEGFSSIDEVAYVPAAEIVNIEEFDEDIVEELRARARDALLARAIATGEGGDGKPAADLLSMQGMDEALANQLATCGICTMEDLAEQAVDDLVEQVSLDPERAASLIMEARAPWFAEETKES
ncbi:NusA antitermination factor [Ectothiorhodosinus mongolicus]|uniref:Transcription termination/antitermination protein NusA n=1 Tax=Ectothiorhodosinus mongolicus TaxID=233100 RepID=A0A1R3VRH2_9GAMM|nr:transcription termination factor NusA [Ectothiorhodosinus mongolicus]ULX56518.1 transcription termination/antitermination protein NusA [Ectothiorhodosinus mongolicus]SIT66197.1 NusA antitermination factor [Ectothiorhodosinus mongolicus]